MRLLSWTLLLITSIVVGCGGNPATEPSPPRATLTPTPDPAAAHIAIVGDAYTSGSSFGGEGPHGWPVLAAKLLQQGGLKIAARVGATSESGYFSHEKKGGVRFIDQVRNIVGSNDRLVIFFGSLNDRATSTDKLRKLRNYVRESLLESKKRAPRARLLVIGPVWSLTPYPPAGVPEARDSIRAGAEEMGATFIDPITEGWFVGRPDMLSSSAGRVNNAGHEYLATKIAPLIAAELGVAAPKS